MVNLVSLAYLVGTLFITGSFLWIAWDQIAYSMHWPRPTYGAGVGVMYIALLLNFLFANKIIMGRQIVNSDKNPNTNTPEGGNRGGTEVRKDPPSDLAPLG